MQTLKQNRGAKSWKAKPLSFHLRFLFLNTVVVIIIDFVFLLRWTNSSSSSKPVSFTSFTFTYSFGISFCFIVLFYFYENTLACLMTMPSSSRMCVTSKTSLWIGRTSPLLSRDGTSSYSCFCDSSKVLYNSSLHCLLFIWKYLGLFDDHAVFLLHVIEL